MEGARAEAKQLKVLLGQAVVKGEGVRAELARLQASGGGEHGGDPYSIAFFAGVGLDYVSCSPYRVPIARLAAAQAAIGRAP